MNYKIMMAALVTLASCAQQKVVVGEKNFVPFDSFSSVSKVSEARAPLKIESVIDARETKTAIGEGRTGARFEKTPVLLTQKTEDFVRDYLERALETRGFLIVQSDEKASLNVRINRLWVEEVIEKYQPEKAKCNIALELTGQKGEQGKEETYTGKFWTEIVSPGDMGDATDKLDQTLASCMNIVAEKIAKDKDLIKFLQAKPLI